MLSRCDTVSIPPSIDKSYQSLTEVLQRVFEFCLSLFSLVEVKKLRKGGIARMWTVRRRGEGLQSSTTIMLDW